MLIELLTSDLGVALIGAILSGLAWLGSRFVLRNVRWKRGREVLERLGVHAQRAVLAVHQTYTEAIKAGKSDGKLTDEEARHARALALAKLRTFAGWDDLVWILGGELEAEDAAETAIESAVALAKRTGLIPSSKPAGEDRAPLA